MALEPRDRYTSARALAEDIERWMADEPVLARPEPMAERTLRWMRRRRTAVTAAVAAAMVALVGLFVVLAVQARANQRPHGGQRPRAGPVRPRHGSHQDVPHRRQRGPPPQGIPVPGAAHQAAARAAGVLRQARDPAQGPDRPPLAARDGAGLRRAGRADGQDRLEARGAGAVPTRAGDPSGAGARRAGRRRRKPRSAGACWPWATSSIRPAMRTRR